MVALWPPDGDAGTATLPVLTSCAGDTQQLEAEMSAPGCNVSVPLLLRITGPLNTSPLPEMVVVPARLTVCGETTCLRPLSLMVAVPATVNEACKEPSPDQLKEPVTVRLPPDSDVPCPARVKSWS